MESLRIGLVGCGRIATGMHLPQYPQIPEARLIAFYDEERGRAAQMCDAYVSLLQRRADEKAAAGDRGEAERLRENANELVAHEDFDSLLEAVDAVDVCVPPRWHVPLALKALAAGRSAMVEKPMARSWLDAQRVASAPRSAGAIYQHNENFIFDQFYMTVRKIVASGEIGDLLSVRLSLGHGGPDSWTPFWFCDYRASGGGSLIDFGTHSLTTAWFLAGFDKVPTKVRSMGISVKHRERLLAGRFQRIAVEDDGHFEVLLEDPKTGGWCTLDIEGTWSWPEGEPLVVQGTKGTITRVVEDGKAVVAVTPHGHGPRLQRVGDLGIVLPLSPYSPPTSFLNEIRNFVVAARSGVPSICDERVGIETTAILQAAYLSECEGRRGIALDEFEAWSRRIAEEHPTLEEAENAIVERLMEPYRSS